MTAIIAIFNWITRIYALTLNYLLGRRRWDRQQGRADGPLIAFFGTFAYWLTLPALPLLALSLWRRRWREVLLLLPSAGFLLNEWRVRRQPQIAPAALTPHLSYQFTVLTFNMHAESEHTDAIAAVIRASGADVVALQEVSRPAAAYFDAQLRDLYPYQACHHGSDPTDGQGILSKSPIQEDEYWQNSALNRFVLGHQRVKLELGGRAVVLYNSHPVHPGLVEGAWFDEGPRGAEIAVTLRKAAAERDPTILLGDFNMPDQSQDYQRITALYRDAYRDAATGWGLTFPDLTSPQARSGGRPLPPLLLLRLDYQFYSAPLVAQAARVWPTSGGSDHRPVWVQYAWSDQHPE